MIKNHWKKSTLMSKDNSKGLDNNEVLVLKMYWKLEMIIIIAINYLTYFTKINRRWCQNIKKIMQLVLILH